jgi:hypothetical protein
MNKVHTLASHETQEQLPQESRLSRLRPQRLLLLIVVVNLIVYGNTLFNKFTYDDKAVILESSFITSLRNLPGLVSQDYFDKTIERSYRPVVTLSYFIEHALWQKHPMGYHATNLALHIANALLVYWVLIMFFPGSQVPVFGALVFSLHPVNTEAVNAISFREDLMATFFVLLTVALYVQSFRARRRNGLLMALSLPAALLAMLSKESAAPLPVLLLLMELVLRPSRKARTPSLQAHMPLLLVLHAGILAFYLLIRFVLMAPSHALPLPIFGLRRDIAAFNFLHIFVFYWSLFLIPKGLCLIHDIEPILNPFHPIILGSAFFCVGYLVALWLLVRFREPILAFGLMWIGITFLPVSNVIPISNPVAERYMYLPAVGFALIAARLAEVLWGILKRIPWQCVEARRELTMVILCAIPLLLYAYGVVYRNLVWGNDKLLWSDTYRKSPNAVPALDGMAHIHFDKGEIEKARALLEKAVQLNPNDYQVHNNLGVIYAAQGHPEQAIQQLTQSLAIWPNNGSAHYNLARIYAGLSPPDYERASYHLEQAKNFGYPVPETLEEQIGKQLSP